MNSLNERGNRNVRSLDTSENTHVHGPSLGLGNSGEVRDLPTSFRKVMNQLGP